ncbi:hypothetical protein CAC42_1449 [Sphaceloma murrayae]|uniref:DNA helicase n=1 Tax=Sphaceloma murrayae TaxID=2082308 RepID=A0A2K1QFP3_9PEZI|nr:hypothetical protein CAC42_1449 [Sphaceloma murrayae]
MAAKGGSIFAQTLASLQSSLPQGTQPTQPWNAPRSSPEVEVLASSPMKPSPAPRPRPSVMAPPGTTFRRPGTTATQSKPQSMSRTRPSQDSLDPSAFDDPPIDHSDDENDDLDAGIRPSSFVRSHGLNLSQFAYSSNPDDMASAYGSSRRNKAPRQGGPARALPVEGEYEMELDDIIDTIEREKVERMQLISPHVSVSRLFNALRKKRGHVDDACAYLLEDEEDATTKTSDLIDLTSDDMPTPRPFKTIAPMTKREIHAKNTIADRYTKKPQIDRRIKKPEPEPIVISSPPPKPRRRLVKGRKVRDEEEKDEDEDEGVILPVDEEDSSDAEHAPPPHSASETGLLKFLNECSALALADLANEKEATASLILTHRPFKNLDQIREITAGDQTKAKGKRSARKTIGEKVLDVCEEMWDGYEAVDKLVDECKRLGEPVLETMRKWTHGKVKEGELEITKLDDPHDSGIGTPSSGFSETEDVVSPVKRTSKGLLKQPSIMSKDLVMKDYQVTGLNWLNLLWSKRLSCILADDMGLGKTCQVISFLSHLKETEVEGTHLIIVPGSTIENWLREFSRFSPTLNVQAYYGSQAEREELRSMFEEDLDNTDVLVTTYDLATKPADNKFLRKIVRPRVCVFDEGHMLKNATSNRHTELSRIRAEFRLLLTGTPLQNNLQELISLLGFIMPDVFATAAEDLESIFKYKATIKDSSGNAALLSTQRIGRARAMLTPFILRRKKAQVLSILPAKHRRVEYCDMTPTQSKLWRSLIMQAMADKTAPASRARKANGNPQTVHMTSLRFAALHPLLLRRKYTDRVLQKLQYLLLNDARSEFRGNPPDLVWKYLTQDLKGGDYALHKFCVEHEDFIPVSFQLQESDWMEASGKMPVLKDMLIKWIEAGSRALIFSQFTTMLDILEAVLSTLGISFVRLDGGTKMNDRQVIIDAFTQDTGIKVFMLSTKAGGAGINLAAADKVVILEGGFNPQDEIQAENRAHRVGQEREVEVVRLVTRGTVEEVILQVGEVKLRLDEKVHGDDGEEEKGEEEGKKRVEEIFFGGLEENKGEGGGVEDEVVEEGRELGEDSVVEEEVAKEEHDGTDGDAQMAMRLEEEEERPRTRGLRRGRAVKKESPEPIEEEVEEETNLTRGKRKRSAPELKPNKQQATRKAAQGADIGAMFRQSLRKKGVNVG